MIRGRIRRGIMEAVERAGSVSYGALLTDLKVLRPALTRSLRAMANSGQVVLLGCDRRPIRLTSRASTRYVTRAQ